MAENIDSSAAGRRKRHRRIALWSLLLIVSTAMILPLSGYVYVGLEEARAQAVKETNPRANMWRAVREGNSGYTSVPGDEAGVLIQDGNNWRQIRNGLIANYGGWFLFLCVILMLLYFGKKGTIPIDGGRSGVKVKRWSRLERFVHWYTAILFIIMTVTGLSTLFGRAVLIPLMGAKGFAAWASIATGLHNYLGPWFAAGVVVIIAMWVRHNIPDATDLKWFKSGGGIIGDAHPDAGMTNGGEKVWFWLICTIGMIGIGSGLVLNFPNWGFTRDTMQLANILHSITGLIWIGAWIGHAYIGTIGSEGSLEGMTTGYVDENWARQHHNLWLEEVKSKGEAAAARPAAVAERPAGTVEGGSPA